MIQLWDVTGVIEVEERVTTFDAQQRPLARRRPLAGVTVEVAGWPDERACLAVWGQATTDGQGRFRLRAHRPAWAQTVRAAVRFADERLVVTDGAADGVLRRDWRPVAQTAAPLEGPTVDLGTLVFRDGAEGALGAPDVVRRAVTWYLARTALDFLAALGPDAAFTSRVAMAYPASGPNGTSGVHGPMRTAHIHRDAVRDEWGADTVLRLLMRLWTQQQADRSRPWPRQLPNDFQADAAARQGARLDDAYAATLAEELMTVLWGKNRLRSSGRTTARPSGAERRVSGAVRRAG